MAMKWSVRVKAQHPSGTYRRAGLVFTREPTILDELPKEVRNDPWLIAERVKAEGPAPDKKGPEAK